VDAGDGAGNRAGGRLRATATRLAPAREAARWLDERELNLDHAWVSNDDMDWMVGVERLNTWAATFPPDFLAHLPRLWWLRLRGGSGSDLSVVAG
jgi:hypothetical protein